ncbi:uncharacterized protein BYT42DRAFT_507256 [Radiomyces spectabilis]|uniref:uncharacterized protein n=1 Tax=Radiomyces spectabilis TaxID=64574 RepID=UPI00221ED171|nr:uncharacterized protein BYT42DRAFT_507256 [Radiomyces spectabilis]KAI8393609.1 hypothetical protein BYT42DRAFT_507256 [Radiomyces spectabilis]
MSSSTMSPSAQGTPSLSTSLTEPQQPLSYQQHLQPFLPAPPPPHTSHPTRTNAGIASSPPAYHTRCLARIDDKIYMPFMTVEPVCFIFDMKTYTWEPSPRIITHKCPDYTPFITPIVAIGHHIYLFGGRCIYQGTLSNDLYVLNTTTFELEKIQNVTGRLPGPRFDHSLDVLHDRYLVIFGGLCADSSGENDLFLYDTLTHIWIEPTTHGQIPAARFGHATCLVGDDFYVFGGCRIDADTNMVYDVLYRLDCRTWIWYKYDHPEAMSYRRRLRRTNISHSLREDFVLVTTGQPPRDRFGCTICYVGHKKLVIIGGQTIRQDGDDTNTLHAYSVMAVDVFDLRHRHWSWLTTSVPSASSASGASMLSDSANSTNSSYLGTNIYPNNISCIVLKDHETTSKATQIFVIGQHRTFAASTDSSGRTTGTTTTSGGESSTTNSDGMASSTSPPRRSSLLTQPSLTSLRSTIEPPEPGIVAPIPRSVGMVLTPSATVASPWSEPPQRSLSQTSQYSVSRAIADYDGYLDNSIWSQTDAVPTPTASTLQTSQPPTPLTTYTAASPSASLVTGQYPDTSSESELLPHSGSSTQTYIHSVYSGSGSPTATIPRDNRQYSSEYLSLMLVLNDDEND